jgi:hypothetical protein
MEGDGDVVQDKGFGGREGGGGLGRGSATETGQGCVEALEARVQDVLEDRQAPTLAKCLTLDGGRQTKSIIWTSMRAR